MAWVTDGGGKNFAMIKLFVVREDLRKLADHRHPVFANVIEPAHEWTDQRSTSLCGEEPLVGGEDQRAVRLDPLALQATDGGEAVCGHWNLHHNVGGDLCEGESLFHHAVSIVADHFGGDWALGQPADLLEEFFIGATHLGVKRRIRRDAVNDPPADAGLDLADVRRIKEELHDAAPVPLLRVAALCAAASIALRRSACTASSSRTPTIRGV